MNGEKQKFIGGVDFDELRAQRVQVYNTIIIDLATARANEEMVFTGNYIYALEATDVDANLDIRFNELFRGAINFKKGRGVRAPFYRFYITNTAQAGKTLSLAIGVEASDFEVFDVGKALQITGNIPGITDPVETYLQNLADGWATEGFKATGAADEIMADTGQLAAGKYGIQVFAGMNSTNMSYYRLEHRNAANDTTLHDSALFPAWTGTLSYSNSELAFEHKGFTIAANERIRVVLAIIVGAASWLQTVITWVRIE